MKRMLIGTVSLTGLLAGGAAMAQDAIVEEAPLVQNTVIVTVQKREQDLRDVPVAVTALDARFLDDLGLDEFESVARFVPGFEVQEQSPNNPGFVIRGITSDSGEASIEPRIAVFQDGVSISRSRGSIVELFDIERVEVAKGPQPTLFGRGALIGGVNIIQGKADLEDYSGKASAGFGNYNELYLDGYVTGPIVEDKLGFRLAARRRTRDGYVTSANPEESDFNSQDMTALRASFAYAISPDSRLDLILNYQKDEPSGTSFKSGAFLPAEGGSTAPWDPAFLNTFGDFLGGKPLGLDREVMSATLIGEFALSDALTLTSITGVRKFESLEVFDPDGFSLDLLIFAEDAEGEQLSQEFRLNYDNGGAFSGFVGASYSDEDGSQYVPLTYDERAVQAFLAGLIVPPTSPDVETLPAINLAVFQATGGTVIQPLKPIHNEFYTNYGTTESIDVFADGTLAVTDRLDVTAGVRFTSDEKTTGIEVGNLNGPSLLTFGGIFVTAGTDGEVLTQSDTFEGFTYRAALSYELTDEINVFANYARGRLPEVIAASTTDADQRFTTLPAEEVDSYEVGVKGLYLGGDLLLDSSVFYYEYTNFQSSVVNDNGQIVPINAGNATSYGAEVSANWAPSDTLSIVASYGYNRARFDDSVDGQPQEFGGNPLRLSPDHTFSLATRMAFATPYGEFTVVPSYTWQSEVFFDNTERDLISQDAYGLVNLNVTWDIPESAWSIEGYVTNALNEEYIIDAGNTGDAFGIPTFIAGTPQFFGVRATGRF